MAKKAKLDEIDMRRDLTASFVTKLRDKWLQVGDRVLDDLAEKQPEKFALLVGQIVPREMLLTGGKGDFSGCQTQADIGRKLLEQVGLDSPRQDQIERAAEENILFIARLETIASGH
jgi:hypothetical protein